MYAATIVGDLEQLEPAILDDNVELSSPGIDGIFRFNTDGTLDRGLAVLRVGSGGFHVIDPAPTTFEGHGS